MKFRMSIMAGVVLALAGCIDTYGESKDLGIVKTINGKDYRVIQSTKRSKEYEGGTETVSRVFLLYPVWMPPSEYHGSNAVSECEEGSASLCGRKFQSSVDFHTKYEPNRLRSPKERIARAGAAQAGGSGDGGEGDGH